MCSVDSVATHPGQLSPPRSPICPAFSAQGFHTTVSASSGVLVRLMVPPPAAPCSR